MTTSNPILIEGKSFVTKTEGNTATIVRTATGKNIAQTENIPRYQYHLATKKYLKSIETPLLYKLEMLEYLMIRIETPLEMY